MSPILPAVTVGFQQNSLSVSEDIGSIQVCAVLTEGNFERDFVIQVSDESFTALGELNQHYE